MRRWLGLLLGLWLLRRVRARETHKKTASGT